MSKVQLIALAMVIVAELVRGIREAKTEITDFIKERRNNPTKFWKHFQHAAVCSMLCTVALAPSVFYALEEANRLTT